MILRKINLQQETLILSEYSLAGRSKSSMGNAKYQREIKSIFAMDRTISQQIHFLKLQKVQQ